MLTHLLPILSQIIYTTQLRISALVCDSRKSHDMYILTSYQVYYTMFTNVLTSSTCFPDNILFNLPTGSTMYLTVFVSFLPNCCHKMANFCFHAMSSCLPVRNWCCNCVADWGLPIQPWLTLTWGPWQWLCSHIGCHPHGNALSQIICGPLVGGTVIEFPWITVQNDCDNQSNEISNHLSVRVSNY